jgi:hypothetical protein
MDVEVATSSAKSLQRATVNSTFNAEDVPPKCLCWCQQQHTMPTVRTLLCLEEPLYFVASRPVNNTPQNLREICSRHNSTSALGTEG